MSKLKRWLYNKFLPAWCKDNLMEANATLAEALDQERRENERLRAYINGMERALRYQKRIAIKTGEVKP